MMARLKTAGTWGVALVLLAIAVPISVVSAVITTQLMFAALGIAVAVAIVGYVVLLPATIAASLTGQEDNPKFVFGVAGVVAALLITGLMWFTLDQRAKAEAWEARSIAEVQAGKQILCDHPESSASGPMYFPADMLHDAVQKNGWTCWAGSNDVYHPIDEPPFLDRFEFP